MKRKFLFFSRRNKNRNWIGMRKEIDFIFVTLVHLLATHFTLSYFTWTRKQCCWWFLCYCVYFFRTFSFFSPHQQPMCTWCSGAYFFSLCTQCTEHADELKSTKERRSSRNEHEKMHQSQVSIYGHITHTGMPFQANQKCIRKYFYLFADASMQLFYQFFIHISLHIHGDLFFALARSIDFMFAIWWHWHALKENVNENEWKKEAKK